MAAGISINMADDWIQALMAIEWAKKVEKLGAGEILLTSMDCDGTKAGYDIELTRAIADAVSVPVIASGGAGTLEHFYDALTEGGADAALAASLFLQRIGDPSGKGLSGRERDFRPKIRGDRKWAPLSGEWLEALKGEFHQPYYSKLYKTVMQEYQTQKIFPPAEDMFNAFHFTPLSQVKVVILGQDPYHNDGQAAWTLLFCQKRCGDSAVTG